MIGNIELPVGTRFKVRANGREMSLEVIESFDCDSCAFYDRSFGLCPNLECGGAERTDSTPVIFRKTTNN